MLIVVLGREPGLCKRLPGGLWVTGMQLVRGWRGASLCLSPTGRLDCHLSGMSCSHIAAGLGLGKSSPQKWGDLTVP